MFKYNPLHCLPSAEDLPDSDDKPVDNQLQDLIPHLLLEEKLRSLGIDPDAFN